MKLCSAGSQLRIWNDRIWLRIECRERLQRVGTGCSSGAIGVGVTGARSLKVRASGTEGAAVIGRAGVRKTAFGCCSRSTLVRDRPQAV